MSDKIICRAADESHLPLLKELWLRCFPEDRPGDVDRFYNTLFSAMVCLIGTVDGRPVTMLHLLPAHAYVRGTAFPVRYLYAGCTHPDHRHRGYYAALLQYAKTYVSGMGECGIYLHPATESLVSLYEQAGYCNSIVSCVPRPCDGDGKILSGTAEDHAELRRDLIRQLECDFAYFEPETAVSQLFLAGLMCEGASLHKENGRVLLVRGDTILDSLPPVNETHHTAMWIATGEEHQLSHAMNVHGGYTALLGE